MRAAKWLCLVICGAACLSCEGDKAQSPARYNGTETVLRDYHYAENRRFDLGTIGDSLYLKPGDTIKAIVVFALPGRVWDAQAVAFVDIQHPDLYPGDSIAGTFQTLSLGRDYWVNSYVTPPYVSFDRQVASEIGSSAVAYFLSVRGNGRALQLGDTSTSPLRLQLLKPRDRYPNSPLGKAEWKNIYDLQMKDIDFNLFALDIFKGPRGTESQADNPNHQNGVPYLQLLGLDNYDPGGRESPDGRIDGSYRLIDVDQGLLIFPDRRPFDPPPGTHHSKAFPDSSLRDPVPSIYDALNWQEQIEASKYYMVASVLYPVRSR
jgi:hypothetical protein